MVIKRKKFKRKSYDSMNQQLDFYFFQKFKISTKTINMILSIGID